MRAALQLGNSKQKKRIQFNSCAKFLRRPIQLSLGFLFAHISVQVLIIYKVMCIDYQSINNKQFMGFKLRSKGERIQCRLLGISE